MTASPLEQISKPLARDSGFPRLKEYLIDHTGLAYYSDKDAALAESLSKRLATLGLPGCDAYLDFLRDGSAGEIEMDALIVELTIGETYFFRHREQLEALRLSVIPEIIRKNVDHRRLRIWSVGCASGEEPYSLSILLKDEFKRELAGWDVSILGTDINRDFLARAREGKFGEWAFRTNTEEFKCRRFQPSGKAWILNPEYREGITFQYHNLAKHPFPSLVQNISAFDLIVCRNVMIYFSAENCQKIIARFHDCLVEGGWLLLGHSESAAFSPSPFATVPANGVYLYRRGGATLESGPTSPAAPALGTRPAIAPPQDSPFGGRSHELPPESPSSSPPAPASERPDIALARRLADQGDWETAAHVCAALLKEEKLNAPAYFCHALVLEQLGESAQAEEELRKVLYLDRANALAHYHLGLFLLKKADEQGATRSFQNVLRLLERRDPGEIIVDADGLTAADLGGMATMQLEVLKA